MRVDAEERPTKDGASHEVSGLTPEFMSAILSALEEGRDDEITQLANALHPADLADLIEKLSNDHRADLVERLRGDLNPNMIAELDESVFGHVVDQLGVEEVAEVVAVMDTDDAVGVIGELGEEEQQEFLEALPEDERALIEQGLAYPEDSAGRLMQRHTVAMADHSSVGQAIDFMRDRDDLPSDFFDVVFVNPAHQPVGTVPLSRIMSSHRNVALTALMVSDMKIIPVRMDQEDVAFLFRQRDLVSASVVDDGGRLVGVITVDDIVDVIHEEHEEDIKRLGGVGEDDDLYSAILHTTRSRFTWLFVHLIAAIIAAYVISFFAATIEQMVALAVLMPIVATMGGTASVQALTVAVRAIAMKELSPSNAVRAIGKEVLVSLFNGVMFALIIGVVAWFWFDNPALGGVIAMAIVINLVVAGLAGSALPVLLDRLGFDPALASSAFLTSITDVVGFYAFLGLASILLL
jgi:magnesium transporter